MPVVKVMLRDSNGVANHPADTREVQPITAKPDARLSKDNGNDYMWREGKRKAKVDNPRARIVSAMYCFPLFGMICA